MRKALVVAIALSLAAPASHCALAQTPPAVSVAAPLVKSVVEREDFIGRFEAADQVDIRARVDGHLSSIAFADGAFVNAGDLLAVIERDPYQAAVDQAAAEVEATSARIQFARADLERAVALQRSGNIANQLADTRQQSYAVAQAEAASARAALQRAELDLRYTEIRAPISGRLSRRNVSVGALVSANDTVLTNIVSVDPVHFYFDVDERSFLAFRQLASGGLASSGDAPNEVEIALTDDESRRYVGHVDFTENRLDAASGTMRARVSVANPDGALTPGLFGRATLRSSDPYEAVMVPEEAVASDLDRRIVYVIGEDDRIAVRPVRLGPIVDGYRVVREGLAGDERVVVNGLMRVRPGIVVTPETVTLPSAAPGPLAALLPE